MSVPKQDISENVSLPLKVIEMQKDKLDLNTHKNDGTLGLLYHHLIKNDDKNNLLSFDQSMELIDGWFKESKIPSPERDRICQAINLLKTDKKNNYDDKNNIHVEELLPRVVDIVKNFEFNCREGFLTILGEIVELGSCSQGRTTRLLEYYAPFRT